MTEPNTTDLMKAYRRGDVYQSGAACYSCTPQWKEKIRELVLAAIKEVKEGGEDYSLSELHGFLKRSGYRRGRHSLRDHITNHEPELRKQWDERYQTDTG